MHLRSSFDAKDFCFILAIVFGPLSQAKIMALISCFKENTKYILLIKYLEFKLYNFVIWMVNIIALLCALSHLPRVLSTTAEICLFFLHKYYIFIYFFYFIIWLDTLGMSTREHGSIISLHNYTKPCKKRNSALV